MKLATYKDGSRDGQLVVVSRDLASAHFATGIATRLQQVLDDWNFLSPQLEDLYQTLNHGKARHAFAFETACCMAPLPRAYQWAIGDAYAPADPPPLAQAAEGAAPADAATPAGTAGAMRSCAGDELRGPADTARFPAGAQTIDFDAQLAVVTGDVAMGALPEQALESVRLLMLASAWRCSAGDAPAAFAPVAVTLDELGPAWQGGRVHLTLQVQWNGRTIGLLDAGPPMQRHFGLLIASLARTRAVRAGSIVGSGPVRPADPLRGQASLAARRTAEAAETGAPKSGYAQAGDRLRVEVKGSDGLSLFGAIDQPVDQPAASTTPEPRPA